MSKNPKDPKEEKKSKTKKHQGKFTDNQAIVRNSFVGGKEWTVSIDGVVVVQNGQWVEDEVS